MRPTVVCLGEALALVPALPIASTVSGPGTAHRAGTDPLGGGDRP
jgi:hypothetical protein